MNVRKLASDFMCQPIRITVGSDELTANSRVEQTAVVLLDGREKEQRLLGILRDHGFTKGGVKKGGGVGLDREKVLVFALYKKGPFASSLLFPSCPLGRKGTDEVFGRGGKSFSFLGETGIRGRLHSR